MSLHSEKPKGFVLLQEKSKPVIALVADGSSNAEGQKALEGLDLFIQERFPEHDVVWAIQAGYMIKALKQRGQTTYFQREIPLIFASELLARLATADRQKIAMQMLMTTENSFSVQALEADTHGMTVKYGLSYLTSSNPENQVELAKSLEPLYGDGEETAIVLIAHGSDKYYQWLVGIDNYVRENYKNVCLATLHGLPGTERMVADVKASGCKKVRFISLMMSRGGHVSQDIMNDERPNSWKNRIGLPAEVVDNYSENESIRNYFIRSIQGLLQQFE